MHTEEVDLSHGDGVRADTQGGWDSCDEAHQPLGLARPHPYVPVLPEARWLQSPLQELSRVFEPANAQSTYLKMTAGRDGLGCEQRFQRQMHLRGTTTQLLTFMLVSQHVYTGAATRRPKPAQGDLLVGYAGYRRMMQVVDCHACLSQSTATCLVPDC